MTGKALLLTFLVFYGTIFSAVAQQPATDADSVKKILPPVDRFYVGTALDGAIFSSATIKETVAGTTTNKLGTLRFSDVINFGFTFNYNFGRHVGMYTGIDLKNIGFIEKDKNGAVVKRRTYNLGVPLGIKIGNMVTARPYLCLGGGIDAPFNYREKTFVIRDQKSKFSEWFSNRTPAIMPYVFVGAGIIRGATIKLQYYPTNFMNTGYTDKSGNKIYADYDVHLILVSLGFPLQVSKHHDLVKQQLTGPTGTHIM